MIRKPLRFSNISTTPISKVHSDYDALLWIQNSMIHIQDSNSEYLNSIKNVSALNIEGTDKQQFTIPIWNRIKFESDTHSINIQEHETEVVTPNGIVPGDNEYVLSFGSKEDGIEQFFYSIDNLYSYTNFVIDLSLPINSFYILIDNNINFDGDIIPIHINVINYSFTKSNCNILVRNKSDYEIEVNIINPYIRDTTINTYWKNNDLYIGPGMQFNVNPKQITKFTIDEYGFHPDYNPIIPNSYNSMIDVDKLNWVKNIKINDTQRRVAIIANNLSSPDEISILTNDSSENMQLSYDDSTIIWVDEMATPEFLVEALQIPESYNIESVIINGTSMVIPTSPIGGFYNIDISASYANISNDIIIEINNNQPNIYKPRAPLDSDYCLFISATTQSQLP